MPALPLIRPPALRHGDTVAVIAPASAFERALFEAGCAELKRLGYKVVFRDDIFDRDIYFAGSSDRRVHEFHRMWQRDDVGAIICARGGYGCNYLLPHVDLDLIRRHPKIFLGCSDITALHTYIHDETGLVTFHGPMLAGDLGRATVNLTQLGQTLAIAQNQQIPIPTPLRSGAADGKLYGGCLSILVASLGTPYEVQTDDSILFLEDIAEPAYRLDRMLMQLNLAGKLRKVRGIIFGEMQGCTAPAGHELKDILLRVIADLNIPVAYGLTSGHVTSNSLTLPIGVTAQLRVNHAATLTIESAVTPA